MENKKGSKIMNSTYIYEYLAGKLDESKSRELLNWVNASEDNRKLFSELKNTWTLSKRPEKPDEAFVQSEFELFRLRMAINSNQPQVSEKQSHKTRKMGYYLLRIAAMFLLIYSSGITVAYFQRKTPVEYNEIFTKRGEKSKLVLSDGTKIWINSESHLRYPTQLTGKKVEVFLEGEAYFDVAKLKGRAFIVKASDLNISVLGTSFNVKSYAGDENVEATLVEGKILITGKMGKKRLKDPIVLEPSQRIMLKKQADRKNRDIVIEKVTDANQSSIETSSELQGPDMSDVLIRQEKDTKPYTAWKDGSLDFRRERLEDLEIRLERWYDVEIEIKNDEIRSWRYTGTFDKETIEQALHALSLSMPFAYNINKNLITIEKKSVQ